MLSLEPPERQPAPATEPGRFLKPGANVWRSTRAERTAVLIDGAAYFGALREALLQARETVHIVGWDLDSRMRLVGPSGKADDGFPEPLVDFLTALVARRPRLRIRLLLWDYSVLFSLQRELAPLVSFLWSTPPQIEICLDDQLPLGASHHQKIVVIDDAVAFSGGLDLTTRRWDTSSHDCDNPCRTDPSGATYAPFHDVQMVVDGEAARALGDIVRARWKNSTCETLRPRRGRAMAHDVWPASVQPDFSEVEIGIARTLPHYGSQQPATEVLALFDEMVGQAEHIVYIENQFVTHGPTARGLAGRMRERPGLEAVIVAPRDYDGWVERRVMLAGRLRFAALLAEAGCGDRVRVLYPEARGNDDVQAVMVHSKVMIIDDRLLRIGSANLCNRSMGLDTECDLVVVAGNSAQREAIAAIRNRLFGEHAGLDSNEVRLQLAEGATLSSLVDGPGDGKRRLRDVEDAISGIGIEEAVLNGMADPPEPLYHDKIALDGEAKASNLGLYIKIAMGVAFILLLTFAWRQSPFGEPEKIATAVAGIAERPWAPAAVVGAFLVAEVVAFPVTLLILATITVFGGWTGATLAGLGALSSAMASYAIGRGFGQRFVRRFIGPRINRIRRGLQDRGIVAVATVRLVPLAPFTVVNLVAGAVGVRFVDYMIGTALGLMPGLIVMSALGGQITTLLSTPSIGGITMLVGFILLWVLLGLGLQFLVSRYRPQR